MKWTKTKAGHQISNQYFIMLGHKGANRVADRQAAIHNLPDNIENNFSSNGNMYFPFG